MPITRSRGKPLTSRATWTIASSGLVTTMMNAPGECFAGLPDHGADDTHVLEQQVVSGHARLAGEAGRDHDHVRVGRVGVVVGAHDRVVVVLERRRLDQVECLALRQALDDVDQVDVGDSASAIRCAVVAPTLPAPMTVTLRRPTGIWIPSCGMPAEAAGVM